MQAFLRYLREQGPGFLADCARATWELARAHRRFHDCAPAELVAMVPAESIEDRSRFLLPRDHRVVERVAVAIPGVALRLPWRADCMIQAMAARHWLASAGIGSTMTIGVRKDAAEGFGAHAWLTVGDRVVTGGDISTYRPLDIRA